MVIHEYNGDKTGISFDDIDHYRNNAWVGQIVHVARPYINSSNNVVFAQQDAKIVEIHKRNVLVEDLTPVGQGHHKRRWCVQIKELLMEDPIYRRDHLKDGASLYTGLSVNY